MKTLDIKNIQDIYELIPFIEKYGFVLDEFSVNYNSNYHIVKSDETCNVYIIRNKKLTVVGEELLSFQEFKTIVSKYQISIVNGYSSALSQLENLIEVKSTNKTYCGCFLNKINSGNNLLCKAINNPDGNKQLKTLYANSEEYEMDDVFSDQQAKFYGLFEADQMTAACRISHHYRDSLILSKVITDANHRGKGYGKQLISFVINEYIKQDKKVYLFYNNPIARKLYQSLNITEYGEWTNIKF